MARPLRLEFPGAVYHVMARGNERRDVFRDDSDREEYLARLSHYRRRFGFRLYAFCLMPNHVHLALETGETPLSRIMLGLQSSYTQWFNRRHGRVGHLFQGRYKAILIDKDSYLLSLVRYIHQNPVKAHTAQTASQYRWSSDRHYRAEEAPDWLDTDQVLGMLAPRRAQAMASYRQLMRVEPESEYEDAPRHAQIIRGDESFALRVVRRAADPLVTRRNLSIDRVARLVARERGVALPDLRSPRRLRKLSEVRAIVAYLAKRHGRIPFSRTAEYFRRDGSTFVRDVMRLEERLKSSRALRTEVNALARAVGRE
jgi:REP element-mobilizing transposase RayT